MKDPSGINADMIEEISALKQKIEGLEEKRGQLRLTVNALKKSEEIYRKSFHTNQDSISINHFADGMYVSINEGFTELTGYTEADVIGRTSTDINIWKNIEDRQRLVEGLRKDGEVTNLEAYFRKRDGSFSPGLMSASMFDLDGVPHILSVTRDITQRKEAEEALKDSEEKYRLVVENAGEGIYIAQDGMLLFPNSKALEIFGYPEAILTAKPFREFVHPEDREMVSERHIKRLRGEQCPHVYPFRIVTGDGSMKWVEIHAVTLGWEGKPAVLNFVGDITERKKTEEALYTNQLQLSEAMDLASIVYWELDPADGTFIFNDPFYAFCGTTAEREGGYRMAAGEYGERFMHPDDRSLLHQASEKRLADRNHEFFNEIEHRIIRRDGEVRHVLARIRSTRDAAGCVARVYGANQDITARKQAEKEKRILEDNLRQAQKMEAIGTLAGGIAHDFNNILASMMGYAELAMQESHGDSQQYFLAQILKASDRAKSLVNQILTFSRQREQERQAMDIRPVVKEVLKLLRSTIPSTIRIKQSIPSEDATVFADPTQIHQILMNLATNAAHAMREKGGMLEVNLSSIHVSPDMFFIDSDLKAGPYVLLTVRDTGQGIDPAIREKIFDPFFTTKNPKEGTGLGLAVVYGIIKRHGGAITLQSSIGDGSTFSIYLPRVGKGVAAEIEKGHVGLKGGRERILFADDEDTLVEVVTVFLRSLGYKVASVTNSMEALNLFNQNPQQFDLVVTDMTMPHMTGLELSKKILSVRPDLPIILCTGYHESVTKNEARKHGIKEFALKPLSLTDLGLLIRRTLDGR